MNTRVIKICIEEEPELYQKLLDATTNHTLYDGCYVMQYSEHRGNEAKMIGEFMLRQAGKDDS
jgi:hypothetical protein